MNNFWKVRIATFIWGFIVLYYFTRKIDLTSKAFLIQVIGNSVIMWFFLRNGNNKYKT
jgi:hypothetical protein